MPTYTTATDVYWEVDGVPLNTFAWNIRTIGGDRMSPPPLRGSNSLVPGLRGQVWRKKVPDQKILSLEMWTLGATSDGTVVDREEMENNWRMLRLLLWTPDRQVALTKRWKVDGVTYSATGYAQFDKGLNPEIEGYSKAKFAVDLLMADPFFYGSEVTVPTLTLADPSEAITVAGDVPTNAITLDIAGPIAVPRLTVGTRWMEFTGPTNDGWVTNIDVNSFAANTDDTFGPEKAAGYVQHSGGSHWMFLEPGARTLVLSRQSGTGTMVVKYQPMWM